MTIAKREIEVKAFSKETLGIQSTDEVWYNINKTISDAFKEDVKLVISKLGRGDKVEMTADFEKRLYNVIKINKKSDKKNWADDMTNLEDLLTNAHKKFGDLSITTEKIEIDLKKKYALFKATAITKDHKFEAHGDATADNIDSEKVKKHFIRMAETRAIVRALRFLTNNAACAEEETEKGKDSLEKDGDEIVKR